MKNVFKGFHNVNQEKLEELWKDEQTLFAFDANVLLNLYGFRLVPNQSGQLTQS